MSIRARIHLRIHTHIVTYTYTNIYKRTSTRAHIQIHILQKGHFPRGGQEGELVEPIRCVNRGPAGIWEGWEVLGRQARVELIKGVELHELVEKLPTQNLLKELNEFAPGRGRVELVDLLEVTPTEE